MLSPSLSAVMASYSAINRSNSTSLSITASCSPPNTYFMICCNIVKDLACVFGLYLRVRAL